MRDCDKDWAVADYLESPLEILCSRELSEASPAVPTDDANVDLTGLKAHPDQHPRVQCRINHGAGGAPAPGPLS